MTKRVTVIVEVEIGDDIWFEDADEFTDEEIIALVHEDLYAFTEGAQWTVKRPAGSQV